MPNLRNGKVANAAATKSKRKQKKRKKTQDTTPPTGKKLTYSTQSSVASSTTSTEQTANKSSETMPESNVRVPFPHFKTDDIEAWFRRVEFWFTFNKVTTEKDKFALIASQIDNATVTNLEEVLNPDDNTPYTKLKDKIVKTFEATTTAKINKLLSGCKLGDLKPSQLLAEMKRIGGTVGDDILRNLWSKRLPLHVQPVVAAATKSSLDEVAVIADAIIDVIPSETTINQVNNSNQQTTGATNNQTNKSEIEELRAAVDQLTKSLHDMKSYNGDHFKGRKSRDRSSSRSSEKQENKICRYHRKFGESARLCTKPCSYVSSNEPKN